MDSISSDIVKSIKQLVNFSPDVHEILTGGRAPVRRQPLALPIPYATYAQQR